MTEDNVIKKSAMGAVSNYIGKAVMTLADAAVFFLLTKKLPLNDYGLYAFLIAALSFFAFFISLGIPFALLRFIPEYIAGGKRDLAISVIRSSLYTIIGFGLLLLSVSFFTADKISIIFKIEALKGLFPLIVFIGGVSILMRAQEEILNAAFLQVFRNGCQIVAGLAKLFLFILIVKQGFGVRWLLAAIAAINVIQVLVYFGKIHKNFFYTKAPTNSLIPELKRFCAFSVKEYFYVVTTFFWDMSFDLYIITYLLGSAAAGIFNFAASISFFILHWSPGIMMQSVMSPLFVRGYTKRDGARSINSLFQFFYTCKAAFAFPAVAGIWLLADRLELVLYHNKFAGSIPTLKILVFFIMLQAFTIPIKIMFNVAEKNEISLYCNIVIIYRICASFIFIRNFGIIGAAYAYGTSMIIYFFMHLFFLRKIIKVQYPLRAFLKIFVNSVAMSIAIIVLSRFTGNTLVTLSVVAVTGLLVYLFASYVNMPFRKEEKAMFREALGYIF